MIFTLLYSSKILHNNKHRNIYIYTIGALLYAAIHWILYSSIGDSFPMIVKGRKLLYALAAIDIMYVGKKYEEGYTNIKTIHNMSKPNIEIINNTQNEKCNEEQCINGQCNNEQCCMNKKQITDENVDKCVEQNINYENAKKNEIKENESTNSIPIYEPNKKINVIKSNVYNPVQNIVQQNEQLLNKNIEKNMEKNICDNEENIFTDNKINEQHIELIDKKNDIEQIDIEQNDKILDNEQ